MSPNVSVVVPYYNRANFVSTLLTTVSNQTFKPVEIIFVDNGSSFSDVTSAFLELQKSEVSIPWIFVSTLKTGNANYARNLGARIAAGDYIAYLDSDDEWLPEHLQNAVDTLAIYNSALGVYSPTIERSRTGDRYCKSADVNECISPYRFLFKERYTAQTSSYVLKKSAFQYFTWDEQLKRHQDYDFFIGIALEGKWAYCSKYSSILNRVDSVNGRNFDVKSMIRFLKKWRSGFEKETLVTYLLNQIFFCFFVGIKSYYLKYYVRYLFREVGFVCGSIMLLFVRLKCTIKKIAS